MENANHALTAERKKPRPLKSVVGLKNKMNRQYYSSRNSPKPLTLSELCQKLISLQIMFRDKDYFKCEAGI